MLFSSLPKKLLLSVGQIRSMSSVVLQDQSLTLKCGQKINFVKTGDGPNVALLMPGALGTIRSDFGPQLESLNSRNELTLVAWDPPGYGASRPKDRTWPLDFFHRDAEAAKEFMEKLGHEKFSIAGWSDGGITGLVAASAYPDMVSKLVLWGANAYINPNDIKMVESIRDVSKWSDRMRAPMESVYGKDYFPVLWAEWVDAYKAINEKKGGDICKNDLGKITCPTLIIHGDKDPMVDAEHPGFMNEGIKGSRLYRFPDGKHNVHFKYKAEFNKMVEEFLLE